jgi:hypothetical protein
MLAPRFAVWHAVDRYYLLLAGLVALGVSVLNRAALGHAGLIPYFLDLGDVIRAGFDPAAAVRRGAPTYPMWGYAWLMLLTQNRIILILIQNAVALLATWWLVRTLQALAVLSASQLTALRAALIISVPWYAFHATLWEASLQASLLVMACTFMVRHLRAARAGCCDALAAGTLFGLAANLRADMLLLPVCLAPFMLLAHRFTARAWLAVGVCLASAYGLLLPWAAYTRAATGQTLFSSTNGGLVAMIGFGADPANPWHITLEDDDPVVRGLVTAELGPTASTVSFQADRLLKEHFLACVREAPATYARRVARAVLRQPLMGVWPVEFFRLLAAGEGGGLEEYLGLRRELVGSPVAFVRAQPGTAALIGLQVGSTLFGRAVILLSFLCLPFSVLGGFAKRQIWFACFLVPIGYKAAVVALLAWADGRFTEPVYVFHVVNITVGAVAAWRLAVRRLAPCEPAAVRG